VTEPAAAEPTRAPRPIRPVGRALALYTTLRLLLFLSVFLLLQFVVQPPLLAVGAAVLVSAIVSIPLLRPWREDLARATAARARSRVDAKAAQRARLDES
jgi:hypothetical protein